MIDNLSQKQKAVLFMLISAFGFALMNVFVKLSGDLPTVQKSFFRNFIAFLIAFFILLRSGGGNISSVSKSGWFWLFMRASLGTVGILSNFYSLDHLLVADASVLNKLSPFFVIILSAVFLGERVNRQQVAAIAVAFLGVLLIAKPSFATGVSLPVMIAILGGFTAGAAYTCVRYLGTMGVNGSLIVCFFSGFSCLVLAPKMISGFVPMQIWQLVILILTGVSAAVGQYGITFAYKYAPGNQISIYDYSNIIFTAVLGTCFLGEIPDFLSIVGAVVMFGAFYINFRFNKKADKIKAVCHE